MGLIEESITLYKREMLIFMANARVNLIRSIMFPIIIIVFFGNIGSTISHTPIAVVNYANNPQSTNFINDMQSGSQQVLEVVSITDENTALQMLQFGNVQAVVVILPNFPSMNPSVPGVEVYYSNTQPQVAAAAVSAITSISKGFGAGAAGIASQSLSAQPSGASDPAVGQVRADALYAANSSYIDFLAGGLLAMVVVFGALFGGGLSLITDRQLGSIKSFLITPINKNAIILSRIISGATQSIIFAILALIVGIVFGVTIAMGVVAIIYIMIVSLLLGMGFSGLAFLIASRIKRVDAYAIFSQTIGLPLWFISGGIVPIASLPSWLAVFSSVDPLTYATDISRAVIMQGFITPTEVLTDIGILVLFAVFMTIAAFAAFKSTIE